MVQGLSCRPPPSAGAPQADETPPAAGKGTAILEVGCFAQLARWHPAPPVTAGARFLRLPVTGLLPTHITSQFPRLRKVHVSSELRKLKLQQPCRRMLVQDVIPDCWGARLGREEMQV